MSERDWFADRPPALRKIYTPLAKHLGKLGPLTTDFVDVGIFFKRTRTFAELRPKKTGLQLVFLVSRLIVHPRVTKAIKTSAHRAACFVDLRAPNDVDEDVRAWLAEAYLASPE
jgi:hypothetical protein